jgi:hypothetical protein
VEFQYALFFKIVATFSLLILQSQPDVVLNKRWQIGENVLFAATRKIWLDHRLHFLPGILAPLEQARLDEFKNGKNILKTIL